MALQKDEIFHGVTVTDAYHKVHYLSGNKNSLNVLVRVYVDSATASANASDHFIEYSLNISGTDLVHDAGVDDKNYVKQTYEFMKANVFTDNFGNSRDYTTGTTDV